MLPMLAIARPPETALTAIPPTLRSCRIISNTFLAVLMPSRFSENHPIPASISVLSLEASSLTAERGPLRP